MINTKNLESLQHSASFAAELNGVSTLEGFQSLLAGHGVEMTQEELRGVIAHGVALTRDELDDEAMDLVVGGVAWAALAGKAGWWLVKTAAAWAVHKGLDKLFGYN